MEEKEKKAQERNDRLILFREELDKKAKRKIRDRQMHHERRQKLKEEQKNTKEERRKSNWPDCEYEDVVETEEEKQLRLEAYRQHIVKESPEIIELHKKLRQAYVRKELTSQLEKKRLEIQDSMTSAIELERAEIMKVIKSVEDSEKAVEREKMLKKIEYRKVLQDQMINRYIEKEEKYKQMLKERALLDDSLRMILEEDQMSLRMVAAKKDKIKKEIEAFKKAKAIWTLREKEIEEKEEKDISDFNQWKYEEEMKLKGYERKRTDLLEKKQEIVFNLLKLKQDSTTEEENNRLIKYQQEKDDEYYRKEHERQIEEVRIKKDLKLACARQIDDALARIQIQKQEEMNYVKEKMKELEDDKKYQQMVNEKKRRMKHELRALLLKEIHEKHFRIKLEEDELLNLKKLEEKDRQERKYIIEEARIKLLQKHTGKLVGFMPTGSLKPSDLAHLPQEVREYYTRQNKDDEQQIQNAS